MRNNNHRNAIGLRSAHNEQYHDTGNAFEADFIESWDSLEVVFEWILARVSGKNRVLQFIAQLCQAGCDRKLRAGQSLEVFIVSRSRDHGLRPDQPRIVFCFHDDVMDVFEENEPKGLMNALASSIIPIAAAITGHAPAGGTVLALFCDWRVAAEGGFTAWPERGADGIAFAASDSLSFAPSGRRPSAGVRLVPSIYI
jgi:hypothetical protein